MTRVDVLGWVVEREGANMNTYTIRALGVTDAALVKMAGRRLAAYDQREGVTTDNSLNGTWDIKQAAALAEHLRSALEIIERLTRPAGYQYTITCCEDVDVYADRETACKCGCTFRATGPNPPAPLPARPRVERVTGTGWPADLPADTTTISCRDAGFYDGEPA